MRKRPPPLAALAILLLTPWAEARFRAETVISTTKTPPMGALAPFPTAGPQDHEILRRQVASDTTFTVLQGLNKTCGYLSGSSVPGLTCSGTSTCMFAPSLGMKMCCGDECQGFLDCTNAEDVDDPFFCDESCQQNQFMLKCKSIAPFCRTLVYPGGITDFDCVRSRPTAMASADFTHTNWKGVYPFQTVTLVVNGGTTSVIISSSTSVIGELEGFGGLGGDIPTFPPPTNAPDPPDTNDRGAAEKSEPAKKDNVGAIVGGTIGGLAVVGMIVVAVAFLLRRGKPGAPPPVAHNSVQYPPSTVVQSPVVQSPVAQTNITGYWQNQGHTNMEDPAKRQSLMQMDPAVPELATNPGGNPQAGQFQVQGQQGAQFPPGTYQDQYPNQVFEADMGIQNQQGIQPRM